MTNSPNFRKSVELFSFICGSLLIGASAIPQTVLAQQPTDQPRINQSSAKVNPCPKIFYEEPHNNRVAVPQGCPPNAFTQRLVDQGQLPQSSLPTNPTTSETTLGVGGESDSMLNPNARIFSEAPYNRSQPGLQIQGSAQPGTTPSNQTPGNQRLAPTAEVTPSPSQQQRPSTRIAINNGKINVRLINDTAANITYQVIGDTAPRSLAGKSDVTLQGLNAPVTVTFQRQDGGLLQATPQAVTESGVLELRLKEATDVNLDRSALRIENNGSVFLN